MAKFIEVTDKNNNKMIINSHWIVTIYSTNKEGCKTILYFEKNISVVNSKGGIYSQNDLLIKESYDEVKSMLI